MRDSLSSDRVAGKNGATLVPSSPVAIFIINDVRVYRDGLKNFLENAEGIVVVGAGVFSDASLLTIATTETQVVLVDFSTSESLKIGKVIMELSTRPKVIAVGACSDEDVLACAEAGLSGYISRDGSGSDLLQVIRDVTENKFVCSPQVTAALVRKISQLSRPLDAASNFLAQNLTTRQAEIAALLGQGLTNKEIGRKLSICSTTVRNHIHAIFEKLNVKRRAEAVAVLHVNGSGPRPRTLRSTRPSSAVVCKLSRQAPQRYG